MSSIGRPTTPPNQSTPATQPVGNHSTPPEVSHLGFPSQPGQNTAPQEPPTQPAIRPGVDNLTPTLRLPSTQSSLNTTQPGGDNTPQTPAGLHREDAFRQE